MTVVYILVLGGIFQLVNSFAPPEITAPDHKIQEHSAIGKFIELQAGSSLKLACTGRYEAVEFSTPKLDDHSGYNETDYNSRKKVWLDESLGDYIFELDNVRESDTGSYICSASEHFSLSESVYVFVHDSAMFLPLAVQGFSFPYDEVMVPCRATKFFDKSLLELRANGELIKDARKNYNHKTGFTLTKRMYENRPIIQVPFECVYSDEKKEVTTFLITELENQSNPDDWVLRIQPTTEWPYAGSEYTFSCQLVYMGTGSFVSFGHTIEADCPRCGLGESAGVKTFVARRVAKSIVLSVQIAVLSLKDTGNYTCVWKEEGVEKGRHVRHVNISPTRGQFKVYESNSEPVNITEGEPFKLAAELAVFPGSTAEYTSEWTRTFVKPGSRIESTPLINSFGRKTQSKVDRVNVGDYLNVTETFIVDNGYSSVEHTGKYILTVKQKDTSLSFEWQVNVMSRNLDIRINTREPLSFVVFEQAYFKPKTKLHIECLALSNPPAQVSLNYRKSELLGKTFERLDPADLDAVNGSYENGFVWNTTLSENIEIECVAVRGSQTKRETKMFRVAEQQPTATTRVEKSKKATPKENPKQIFEDDDVSLDCILPEDTDWQTRWLFRDSEIPHFQHSNSSSRIYSINLKKVTLSDSGVYTCMVEKNGQRKELTQEIQVMKVLKPYVKAGAGKSFELQNGESIELACNIDGTPTPEFAWFKDGQLFIDGELLKKGSILRILRIRKDDEGEFVCRAHNRGGTAEQKNFVKVLGGVTIRTMRLIFGTVTLVIVLFVVGLSCAYMRQKRRVKHVGRELYLLQEQLFNTDPTLRMEERKLPVDQRQYLTYSTEYELDFDNIQVASEELGHGNYGIVKMGWLACQEKQGEKKLTVAVKTPKDKFDVSQNRMLAQELKVMCAIGQHPNVLALVGAVTMRLIDGHMAVVNEFCEGGNLKTFLHDNKDRFINELRKSEVDPEEDGYLRPNCDTRSRYAAELDATWEEQRLLEENRHLLYTSDLLSFAVQIANGMQYLANIPCVHRDLAARNVLITGNRICRIADFGMARHDFNDKNYYRLTQTANQSFPIRWMSIEAMDEQKYTESSDVWAYAITLHELFTFGGVPYPDIPNELIKDKVTNGARNTCPSFCHKEIHDFMLRCWDARPENRPDFSQCVGFVKGHLQLASPSSVNALEEELKKEDTKQKDLANWRKPKRPEPKQSAGILNRVGRNPRRSDKARKSERIYLKDFPA